MSPGRPVVTGFTYTEVLIIDSVLVESIPESFYSRIEHSLLFCTTLSDEQIVNLVIGFGVIEELCQSLLRSVVTCAEDTEVCKEIKRLQTHEYGMTATHRQS